MSSNVIVNDLLTPISAFLKLSAFNPIFLFESVEKKGASGRFSFIGLEPTEKIAIHQSGSVDNSRDFISALRSALDGLKPIQKYGRRIPSGLVGATSFEMLQEFSDYNGRRFPSDGTPSAVFLIPKIVIVFDHRKHSLEIFRTDREDSDVALNSAIIKALKSPIDFPAREGNFSGGEISHTKKQLTEKIDVAQDYIRKGELYQIVMSTKLTGETDIEPFQIYRALRYLYPSPYLFYFQLDDLKILGSSPETMVRMEGDRITLRPLSGLYPKSEEESDNALIIESLKNNEVEKAKQTLFVDQAMNDCASFCSADDIQVSKFQEIESYGIEYHLKSTICANRGEGVDQFDVFRNLFPAGTTVGSPRGKAAEIIADIEEQPRGFYGGSVGYFSPNNTMDHAIAVRTIVIQNQQYSTSAGIAITPESKPKDLAQVILDKGYSTLRALEIARDWQ